MMRQRFTAPCHLLPCLLLLTCADMRWLLPADYSTMATPKSKMPNVKLGHFVRIVGIPTAKI